jgi:hypothetical protein
MMGGVELDEIASAGIKQNCCIKKSTGNKKSGASIEKTNDQFVLNSSIVPLHFHVPPTSGKPTAFRSSNNHPKDIHKAINRKSCSNFPLHLLAKTIQAHL